MGEGNIHAYKLHNAVSIATLVLGNISLIRERLSSSCDQGDNFLQGLAEKIGIHDVEEDEGLIFFRQTFTVEGFSQ